MQDSWQQTNYHTSLATYSPLSGHEKTRESSNDSAILKKGIGMEGEKYANKLGIK